MNEHSDHFTPQTVDGQIEHLAGRHAQQSPNARLVQSLHEVCAQDMPVLKRARARLILQLEERQSRGISPQSMQQVGGDQMKTIEPYTQKSRPSPRLLSSLAAILVVSLLVGSFIFVLTRAKHTAVGGHPPPTQPVAVSMYVANLDGVSKVDVPSGKALWHYPLNAKAGDPRFAPTTLQVVGNLVYLVNGDATASSGSSSSQSILALDASNGKLRWEKQVAGYNTSFQIIGDTLYLGRHAVGESSAGFLYALNRHDGEVRWSQPTHVGTILIGSAYQGSLYVVEGNTFLALDSAHGALKWVQRIDGFFSTAPQLVDGVLYTSACRYPHCSVEAYDPAHGTRLWQSSKAVGEISLQPIIVHHSIYVVAGMGDIYALDAQEQGKERWSNHVGHALSSAVMAGDTLLLSNVNGSEPSPDNRILAVNTADGSQRWSLTISASTGNLVVKGDAVYYGSADGTVQAHQLSDGSLLKAYKLGKRLGVAPQIALAP
jgi:outer membrane protein assembly factor BamB